MRYHAYLFCRLQAKLQLETQKIQNTTVFEKTENVISVEEENVTKMDADMKRFVDKLRVVPGPVGRILRFAPWYGIVPFLGYLVYHGFIRFPDLWV